MSGHVNHVDATDLRPTAAFFLSDLSSKRIDVTMAAPHRSIDPRLPRCRPWLREIPVN